jgi:hypothetical protein
MHAKHSVQSLLAANAAAKGGDLPNMLERPALPEDVAEVIVFLYQPATLHIIDETVLTSAATVV